MFREIVRVKIWMVLLLFLLAKNVSADRLDISIDEKSDFGCKVLVDPLGVSFVFLIPESNPMKWNKSNTRVNAGEFVWLIHTHSFEKQYDIGQFYYKSKGIEKTGDRRTLLKDGQTSVTNIGIAGESEAVDIGRKTSLEVETYEKGIVIRMEGRFFFDYIYEHDYQQFNFWEIVAGLPTRKCRTSVNG